MIEGESYAYYWLLNFEIPEFKFEMGSVEAKVKGQTLMVSSQLWSIMSGEKIRSALIGPGFVRCIAKVKGISLSLEYFVSVFIFDPTQMRVDEPIPVVDIINPEIIDPLSLGKREVLESIIIEVFQHAGNVLVPDDRGLAKISPPGSVPRVYYTDDILKTINVTHVSGKLKAKFVLGGAANYLYRPFLDRYMKNGFDNFEDQKIFLADEGRVLDSGKEFLGEWSIIEKSQGLIEEMSKERYYEVFRDEYISVLEFIKKNEDEFIII
ncbi:MAG: hypothetical protein ACTSR0_06655 [Candidatus Asgardarchaeia archaeon]